MMILMVAAELSPYAEAGTAAATVAAVSRSLVQMGHEVSIVAPKYRGFEEHGLLLARRLSPLSLSRSRTATVLDGQLGSGVKLILVEGGEWFDRPSVYGPDGDYPDNAERFGFFAEAVVALLEQRRDQGRPFDLLHAYDWPGALTLIHAAATDASLRSVLSVHQPNRGGNFPLAAGAALRLPVADSASPQAGAQRAGFAVLRQGIEQAAAIIAPSPELARDLTDESRYGAIAVAASGRPVHGILGGVDYATFNPATDPALAARYDAESPGNKGTCRTQVLREQGLDWDPERPLIVTFVDELGNSEGPRGLAKIRDFMRDLLGNPVLAILVSSSDRVEGFSAIGRRDNFAVVRVSPGASERRLLAAADIALIWEPYSWDGSRIRKAQRYGAVPVASAAGAALDAVVDADAELETGTGFLYSDAEGPLGATERAIGAYGHPRFGDLRRRIMRLDLGWDRTAHRYASIYRHVLEG